jgi:hypothetical protein
MHANEPHKGTGIVAVNKQQLEWMYHDSDELDLPGK